MADSATCANCLSQQSGPMIECDFGSYGCGKSFHISCLDLTPEDLTNTSPWTCDLCTALKNDPAQYLPGGLFGAPGAVDQARLAIMCDNQAEMDTFVASSVAALKQMSTPDFLQSLETTANEVALQQGWSGTCPGWDPNAPFDPTGGPLMTSDLAMAEAICATMPQELEESFEAHVHEMDFASCDQSSGGVEMALRLKK